MDFYWPNAVWYLHGEICSSSLVSQIYTWPLVLSFLLAWDDRIVTVVTRLLHLHIFCDRWTVLKSPWIQWSCQPIECLCFSSSHLSWFIVELVFFPIKYNLLLIRRAFSFKPRDHRKLVGLIYFYFLLKKIVEGFSPIGYLAKNLCCLIRYS